MRLKNKIVFLFSLFIIFILRADFVYAAEVSLLGLSKDATLPEYATYLFNFGMSIAAGLAMLAVIYGGLYYLISLGRGKMTSEGKEWVKSGIMGLLILLCSYLIATTINPQLAYFKMEGLPGVGTIGTGDGETNGLPIVTFDEIPIGTISENLLARTITCYDFDENGDPVDGNPATPGFEPTFMNHDQIDCLLRLGDAVVKKANIFKILSNKIVELMLQCKCNVCDLDCSVCKWAGGACPRPSSDVGTENPCRGDCVGGKCKKGSEDPCPTDVRDKIEHGPIVIEACGGNCRKECQVVCEKEYKEKYKRDCNQACKAMCQDECEKKCKPKDKEYKGLDEYRSQYSDILSAVEQEVEINGEKMKIININVWRKLRLIDQMRYLKEKISPIGKTIENDLNILKTAENKLGNCYLAKSYVDFLKLVETTNKETDTIITTRKIFRDPLTNKTVDISRYCEGFSYAKSQCYQICQNICPLGSTQQYFQSLRGCGSGNFSCLKQNFYNCPANNFGFNTFQNCMTSCKDNCLKECDKKYPSCPEQLNACKEECEKDAKFLENKEEKCFADFTSLKGCADISNNFDDFKKCAKSALKCQYCTNQYAGYPDCLKEPVAPGEEYSSSFFYKNSGRQKYPINTSPYISVPSECFKCPSMSYCPECPCSNKNCSEIDERYLVCGGECQGFAYNDDPATFYCRTDWWNEEQKYELPLGTAWNCSKMNEIPIGQTVDDAEYWAEELIKLVKKFTETTENMVQYIKKIGEEKNYCQCESKCNGNERACTSGCVFSQAKVAIVNPETGAIIGYRWVCWCSISPCSGNPCQKMINLLRGKTATEKCPKNTKLCGIPCYYSTKEGNCQNKCDAGKFGLKEILEELKKFAIEKRSDILKELVYSRKKIDGCSISIYSPVADRSLPPLSPTVKETRILKCEVVEDNLVADIKNNKVIMSVNQKIMSQKDNPLKGECYGKMAGQILKTPEPVADNWFCCELYSTGGIYIAP